MDAFLLDWLNLLLRWAHILVGVAWIGTSFYFIALDYSLRKDLKDDDGIMGSSWLVHGGGFYHVKKYMVAPDQMPDQLKWYKWDAYLTWVTGFALLSVQYYLNAETYLIDAQKLPLTPQLAVTYSVLSLLGGWLVYDQICRRIAISRPMTTAILVYVLVLFAAYLFSQIFSDRGALIHTGAFIGTLMAANVFGVIIPNQKKITASLLAGEGPDPNLGKHSKQRSLHNNYLTLPVLLMMVSNHYPFLARHDRLWIVVGFIVVLGAAVRHVINRHDAGEDFKSFAWALPTAAVALFAAMVLTAPKALPEISAGDPAVQISDSAVMRVVDKHCNACHAPIEGVEEYFVAPQGVKLQTIEDLARFRDGVLAQAVHSEAMPMGNASGMTQEEREMLGYWIAQYEAGGK